MEKLLICISFHFKEKKYKYLKNILDNFLKNYLCNLQIIIDSNEEEAHDLIAKDFEQEVRDEKIRIVIHKNLHTVKLPFIRTKENLESLSSSMFSLTWMHRRHILENINNYDVFMYIEDDIFLSFENYKNYLENFYNLWPNYIPSFVRVEVKDEELYNTDAFVVTKILQKDIIHFNDKRFVFLDNPYHAFWIMPKKELKESINSNFTNVIRDMWLRESAASYGLKSGTCPYACWPSNDIQKIGLVEITDKNKISPMCYSYHLPNNYIDEHRVKFGKIKLDNILKIEAIKKFL